MTYGGRCVDNLHDPLRIDSTKLHFHPRRVAEWLERKDAWETAKSIFPIYVEISPMGACSHRCTFCAVDYIGYKTRQLGQSMLTDRLEEMGALGIKSVMMAGEGEPLLYKPINQVVHTAVANGIDVSFTTNGVLLNKLDLHGVSWVKVSLNAGTKETYAKVHGTDEKDWDRVWKNLKDAVERKGDCMIGVQMVLLPENTHEAQELQDRCDDIGIEYVVFKPYSQHKSSITTQYEGFKGIPVVSGPTAVVREASIAAKEIPYSKCQATPYLWAYLMASGDLYSCSAYLLDPRFNLGNLNTHTFKEVWEGEKRRANWEFVRNELDIHDCRVNCRMDKANIYLNDLVNGVPGRNFV